MGEHMNFTPRAKRIIGILLTEKQPVSIQSLADKMDVSKRTVQRELESINSDLNRYQIQFVSKTGTGV